MSFNKFILTCIISLISTSILANPIIKSCEDYNQESVLIFDQLIPRDSQTTNPYQDLKSATYEGVTDTGDICEVKISRLNSQGCGILAKRYGLLINVNSHSCYAGLIMDVDLDKNTDQDLVSINTYVYPRIFSSDFDKIKVHKDGAKFSFYCHSHIEDRPGYRIGHDHKNNCQIRITE